MSTNVGEGDDWIVWQITMNHDWCMYYKMCNCCNDMVYYTIYILGWLDVEIISWNEGWGLVKEKDEDHVKKWDFLEKLH